MNTKNKSATIAKLNDAFRQTFCGGRVMKTDGVAALSNEVQQKLMTEVKAFSKFEKGNDPYCEHDFGSIKLEGETFFWKIDYYDLAMSHAQSILPMMTQLFVFLQLCVQMNTRPE